MGVAMRTLSSRRILYHFVDIQWAAFMVVLDSFKESLVIEGGIPRVGYGSVSKYVVSKQYLMVQIVSEQWVYRCLQKGSDEQS